MSFFDRMLGRNNDEGSSSKAKDRLQFVLLHERTSIPPEKMRELKAEILEVIAKYIPDIDNVNVDVQVEQSDRYNSKLVAEIPFTQKAPSFPSDIDDGDNDRDEPAHAAADAHDAEAASSDATPDAIDETHPSFHTAETVKHVPPSDEDFDDDEDDTDDDSI